MKKFLKYLLTYFMGFITCVALIVGLVFWAINGVTLSTIEGWTGTTILDETQIDEDAEVNIKGLSLSQLFAEINKISAETDTMTIDKLITRYGLKLGEDIKALLPEKAMGVPLNKLFTEEGKNEILEDTSFDYVYSIIGEEALPEPLKSALSGKSLDKVLAGDMNYIMDGVKLGYIAGVTYEKSGNDWVAVYKNPEEPTLVELLEGVAVNDLLTTFNEGGDILKVLSEGAGEASLNLLIKSITEGDTLLGDGKTVGDFYYFDEDEDAYVLSLSALVGSMKCGHVMGYTPVEEDGEIVGWKTADEADVTSISEAFANIALSDLVAGSFDITDTLGDFLVGELLDYTPVYEGDEIVGWLNGEVEVDEVISKFASAKVSELIEGTFDVDSEIKGMKISDVLGYTSAVYPVYNGGVQMEIDGVGVTHTVWFNGETEVNSIMSSFAEKTIGELTDGISGYTIGLLAGYAEIDGAWYSLEKSELGGDTVYEASDVEGIIKHFVALSVDSLSTDTALEEAINGIVIGEALGYVKVEDVWYSEYVSESENTPVDGVLKSFVGLKISELKNGDTITDAIQDVIVGEEMGYYCEDGVWYTDDTKAEKVTGILASIAGLSVRDLADEETILEKINEQLVGDILGYHYDEESKTWYDNDTESKQPLAGINKTLAGLKVGELSTIRDMNFGDLMGFDYNEDTKIWEDPNKEGNDKSLGKIMDILCKKKVSEIATTVDSLTIADVFTSDQINGTVLSWIPSDTPITNISTTLQAKVEVATLEDYMDIEVLWISPENQDVLTSNFGEEWKGWTITQTLESLIVSLQALSES